MSSIDWGAGGRFPHGGRAVSKYEGLRRITGSGLPHPDWRLVRGGQDLPPQPWTSAPSGWTVRTAPVDQYLFGLPSQHHLAYSDVASLLNQLASDWPSSRFAVYPSWEYRLSGGCLITPDEIVIEVVEGSLAPLTRGRKNPDASYRFVGPFFSRAVDVTGKRQLLDPKDLGTMVRFCRMPEVRRLLVLEWTRTTRNELFFHDWFEQ